MPRAKKERPPGGIWEAFVKKVFPLPATPEALNEAQLEMLKAAELQAQDLYERTVGAAFEEFYRRWDASVRPPPGPQAGQRHSPRGPSGGASQLEAAYRVLGVDPSDSMETITRAYRRRVFEADPSAHRSDGSKPGAGSSEDLRVVIAAMQIIRSARSKG
jgi:hypothetical protein